MSSRLRIGWIYANLALATLVCGTLAMLAALVDWGKRTSWIYSGLWGRWILWSTGLRVTVKGAERLDKSRRYIYMGNHTSLLDIPIAVACLPGSIAFMAKRELFKIPFFGWSLRALGCIPVDRSNRMRAAETVALALKRLRKTTTNMALYPEGTRTRDGKLLPFKGGGFQLAIRSGLPVVPVVTRGAFDALRPGAQRLTSVPISLTIGEPIETSGLKDDDRKELLQQTRRRMEAILDGPG